MSEKSLRKASVFLMALGSENAGKVMSKLPDQMVETLTSSISAIGHVTYGERRKVLTEFIEISGRISGLAFGGKETAKQILEAGFGTRMADSLLERATSFNEIKSFEHLKSVDPVTIANYIKNEHPQTIAVVMAHMDPRSSGPILEMLPAEMQGNVAHRMAVLEAPNQDTLAAVEEVLVRQLQSEVKSKDVQYGGKKQVAQILNEIERETWQEILDEMREIDDEVANDVNNLMFVFEDIVMMTDGNIQEILKEIDGKELTMALKGSTDEITSKIFDNMSKRASEGIAEDMDYMGPVKLSEVEEAQQRVVEVIRSLEEAGTITLGKGGKDAEMVT